jgi:ribose-phosphate pyrophosphokinase
MVGMAMQRLSEAPISRLIITDTIPDGERLAPIADRVTVLSVAPLLAQAVHRIHHDMSISALFQEIAATKR